MCSLYILAIPIFVLLSCVKFLQSQPNGLILGSKSPPEPVRLKKNEFIQYELFNSFNYVKISIKNDLGSVPVRSAFASSESFFEYKFTYVLESIFNEKVSAGFDQFNLLSLMIIGFYSVNQTKFINAV